MAKNKGSRNAARNKTMWDTARARPLAAAAAATAAGAAGIFLWSRRAQISEQVSQLSDQFGEWADTMRSDKTSGELETAETSSRSNNRTKA